VVVLGPADGSVRSSLYDVEPFFPSRDSPMWRQHRNERAMNTVYIASYTYLNQWYGLQHLKTVLSNKDHNRQLKAVYTGFSNA